MPILAATAGFESPGLTIALALAAGLICQAIARHLRLPGLLLLLLTGVLLGPDVAGVIHPEALGGALPVLVAFAVAIILFEGGMNLDLGRIRREQRAIQMLITVGALVTAIGGTLTARFVMGWDWEISAVFGTLVIVTGPTVIGPLLKRIKVSRKVATVLEAEGVLIDAVGAILAAAALEYAVSEGSELGLLGALGSLGFGVGIGLVVGFLLAWLLRFRDLVPEGLENVFVLSIVCALFHVSNAMQHESGIAAVTLAGMVVGNVPSHVQRDLFEFKEQLTLMLIGMLFVLLAADVGLEEVQALGWPGAITVMVLMFVVRPLHVFVGTVRSGLGLRERAFIAWIGPRGIVAAAVASLVAAELGPDDPVGPAFRALVFLVIAVTVATAGITGGPLARLLGLRRPSGVGWVILGARELPRTLARILQEKGQEVLCIDRSHDASLAAEEEGIRVIYGNGLEERTLLRAEIDIRAGAIGLSPNGEVNLRFAEKAKREGKLKHLFVAMSRGEHGITPEMIREAGGQVLFDHPDDVDIWNVRLRRGLAQLETWEFKGASMEPETEEDRQALAASLAHLLLVRERGGKVTPVGDGDAPKEGDRYTLLVYSERRERARRQLRLAGLRPVTEPTKEEPAEVAEAADPGATGAAVLEPRPEERA